jgi:hypothetical protein
MNKAVKIALYSIPFGIGIYLIYRQLRKQRIYTPPLTPKPEVNPIRTESQIASGCDYPLKKGVYNCDLVKQLQWALNNIPSPYYEQTTNLVKYRPLKEDGDFGTKTEAVLIDFWKSAYFEQGDSPSQVKDQEVLDLIMSYVVTDPVKFQAIENPYIIAPTTPTPPTQPPFNPFPTTF